MQPITYYGNPSAALQGFRRPRGSPFGFPKTKTDGAWPLAPIPNAK